ncbi:MAG TPA: hypothetical protein VL593_09915 [Ramlibacter sp.]|jgi:hypothetical protein|nr:hypothetical protein [Ramlibacter sp.]
MNRTLIALALVSLATAARAEKMDIDKMGVNRHPVEDLSTTNEPPQLGQHLTREEHGQRAARAPKHTSSPNMTYHGGKIMTTVVSRAIFWGPKWANASFAGDKITGLDDWYLGHTGSHYAAASNEYTGSNGQVQSSGFLHQGHLVDTSTASSNSSSVLAEVCRTITPDPNGNGYYPVYTDVPRGHANYCAWHSYGTCGGVQVQFAFFFNLDGDAGCDPQDTSGQHSQGLAALANVTGHELSEARTDPGSPGGWYDSQGAENGDKCAWTFGAPLVSFTNGTQWKLQGEWSNAAYNGQTGYPNSSGYKGCLSGL